MASNARYPPWEPHEEVLDTAGLPGRFEGACREGRDRVYLFLTQIPDLGLSMAQSKWNTVRKESAGGSRDSEWAKERRGKRERGQIPGDGSFPQISLHSHDKKGKNGFR